MVVWVAFEVISLSCVFDLVFEGFELRSIEGARVLTYALYL